MNRKRLTVLLLTAILLLSIGCAETSQLKGVWVLETSFVYQKSDKYQQEPLTVFMVYSFDGNGNGTETVCADGVSTTVTFSYQSVRNNESLPSQNCLLLDGKTQIQYSFTGDNLVLNTTDENGVRRRLEFRRISD